MKKFILFIFCILIFVCAKTMAFEKKNIFSNNLKKNIQKNEDFSNTNEEKKIYKENEILVKFKNNNSNNLTKKFVNQKRQNFMKENFSLVEKKEIVNEIFLYEIEQKTHVLKRIKNKNVENIIDEINQFINNNNTKIRNNDIQIEYAQPNFLYKTYGKNTTKNLKEEKLSDESQENYTCSGTVVDYLCYSGEEFIHQTSYEDDNIKIWAEYPKGNKVGDEFDFLLYIKNKQNYKIDFSYNYEIRPDIYKKISSNFLTELNIANNNYTKSIEANETKILEARFEVLDSNVLAPFLYLNIDYSGIKAFKFTDFEYQFNKKNVRWYEYLDYACELDDNGACLYDEQENILINNYLNKDVKICDNVIFPQANCCNDSDCNLESSCIDGKCLYQHNKYQHYFGEPTESSLAIGNKKILYLSISDENLEKDIYELDTNVNLELFNEIENFFDKQAKLLLDKDDQFINFSWDLLKINPNFVDIEINENNDQDIVTKEIFEKYNIDENLYDLIVIEADSKYQINWCFYDCHKYKQTPYLYLVDSDIINYNNIYSIDKLLKYIIYYFSGYYDIFLGNKYQWNGSLSGSSTEERLYHPNLQISRGLMGWSDINRNGIIDIIEDLEKSNFENTFPNEIDFYRLWGLHNTSTNIDTDAPEGWNFYDKSDKEKSEIIVAVIDSGVDYLHEDLKNQMWDGTKECYDINGNIIENGCPYHGWDFTNDNDNNPIPNYSSHGTHVAGTIAAETNNAKGIVGIAKGVQIMALKAGEDYLETADLVESIIFAEKNGANVINASWGGNHEDCKVMFDQAMYDAIKNFSGLFIAAAGNSNREHNFNYYGRPSDFGIDTHCWMGIKNIISVAAINSDGKLADFSDFGSNNVHIGAPGVDIYSSIQRDFDEEILFDFNSYNFVSENCQKKGNWGFTENQYGIFSDINNKPYLEGENDNFLKSPILDLEGRKNVNLEIFTNCDTEFSSTEWTDYLSVQISNDNGNSFYEIARLDEYVLKDFYYYKEEKFDAIIDDKGWSPDISIKFPLQIVNKTTQIKFQWITNNNGDTGSEGGGCKIYFFSIKAQTKDKISKYKNMDGTSMATPHVAGIAGTLMSYDNKKDILFIKEAILNSGTTLSSLIGKTISGKNVNLYNALQYMDQTLEKGILLVYNIDIPNNEIIESQDLEIEKKILSIDLKATNNPVELYSIKIEAKNNFEGIQLILRNENGEEISNTNWDAETKFMVLDNFLLNPEESQKINFFIKKNENYFGDIFGTFQFEIKSISSDAEKIENLLPIYTSKLSIPIDENFYFSLLNESGIIREEPSSSQILINRQNSLGLLMNFLSIDFDYEKELTDLGLLDLKPIYYKKKKKKQNSTSDFDIYTQLLLNNKIIGNISGFYLDLSDLDKNITKAEIVKNVVLAKNLDYKNAPDVGFDDVSTNNQFTPYINAAVEDGIILGPEWSSKFEPNTPFTKEQALHFLVNNIFTDNQKNELFYKLPNDYLYPLRLPFEDYLDVSKWAKRSAYYGYITSVFDGPLLSPEEKITRKNFYEWFVKIICARSEISDFSNREINEPSKFTDISEEELSFIFEQGLKYIEPIYNWDFYFYLNEAFELGIFEIPKDKLFRPYDPIKLKEAIVWISKTLKINIEKYKTNDFNNQEIDTEILDIANTFYNLSIIDEIDLEKQLTFYEFSEIFAKAITISANPDDFLRINNVSAFEKLNFTNIKEKFIEAFELFDYSGIKIENVNVYNDGKTIEIIFNQNIYNTYDSLEELKYAIYLEDYFKIKENDSIEIIENKIIINISGYFNIDGFVSIRKGVLKNQKNQKNYRNISLEIEPVLNNVSNFRIKNIGATYIELEWDDNNQNKDGFELFVKSENEEFTMFLPPNINHLKLNCLYPNSNYNFDIKAFIYNSNNIEKKYYSEISQLKNIKTNDITNSKPKKLKNIEIFGASDTSAYILLQQECYSYKESYNLTKHNVYYKKSSETEDQYKPIFKSPLLSNQELNTIAEKKLQIDTKKEFEILKNSNFDSNFLKQNQLNKKEKILSELRQSYKEPLSDFFVISGLEQNTEYDIKVEVENIFGVSEPLIKKFQTYKSLKPNLQKTSNPNILIANNLIPYKDYKVFTKIKDKNKNHPISDYIFSIENNKFNPLGMKEYKDFLYYSGWSGLYKVKKDGTQMQFLINDDINDSIIFNDFIYASRRLLLFPIATGWDESLFQIVKMDLNGNIVEIITDLGNNFASNFFVKDNYIYYLSRSRDNRENEFSGLFRFSIDDNNPEKILNDNITDIKIINDKIYYLKNNELYEYTEEKGSLPITCSVKFFEILEDKIVIIKKETSGKYYYLTYVYPKLHEYIEDMENDENITNFYYETEEKIIYRTKNQLRDLSIYQDNLLFVEEKQNIDNEYNFSYESFLYKLKTDSKNINDREIIYLHDGIMYTKKVENKFYMNLWGKNWDYNYFYLKLDEIDFDNLDFENNPVTLYNISKKYPDEILVKIKNDEFLEGSLDVFLKYLELRSNIENSDNLQICINNCDAESNFSYQIKVVPDTESYDKYFFEIPIYEYYLTNSSFYIELDFPDIFNLKNIKVAENSPYNDDLNGEGELPAQKGWGHIQFSDKNDFDSVFGLDTNDNSKVKIHIISVVNDYLAGGIYPGDILRFELEGIDNIPTKEKSFYVDVSFQNENGISRPSANFQINSFINEEYLSNGKQKISWTSALEPNYEYINLSDQYKYGFKLLLTEDKTKLEEFSEKIKQDYELFLNENDDYIFSPEQDGENYSVIINNLNAQKNYFYQIIFIDLYNSLTTGEINEIKILNKNNLVYDIDGDGQLMYNRDGLIILRYLFSFSGNSLISKDENGKNIITEKSTRTSIEEIEEYLLKLDNYGLLDIDGNNQSDALTDGLTLMYYMQGDRNEKLIQDIDPKNSIRKTPNEIINFIENYSVLLKLKKGWNNIAFPVNQCSRINDKISPVSKIIDQNLNCKIQDIKDVFYFIDGKYEIIHSFDINGAISYNPILPIASNMNYIAPGYGYRIKMKKDADLVLKGEQIKNPTINLDKGWNYVGYYGPNIYLSCALHDLIESKNLQSVIYQEDKEVILYDAQNIQNEEVELNQGSGYFIRVNEEAVWNQNNISCNHINNEEIIEMNFSVEINEDHLNVIVNGGVFSKHGEITEIEFAWGDGTVDKQWFPASHAYKTIENFDLNVTARDDKGNSKTISKKIRLLSDNILNLESNHITFSGFPESYFDGSKITPQRTIEILEIIYEILKNAHHNILVQDKITFIYEDSEYCGAFSDSRKKEVTICKGFTPNEYHPWGVYAHEMSHNIAGQNLEFLYLAEHGFSAFLDEHQAEILPEYVYQKIKSNPDFYNINEYELNEIKKSNDDNRSIQKDAYKNYIKGKLFYLLQDDVSKATQTGQALSHFVFNLMDKTENIEALKIFNRFLKNDTLNAIGFGSPPQKVPTQEELSTYIIAAYSIAFDTNLSNNLISELNFLYDEDFYQNIYPVMQSFINKTLKKNKIVYKIPDNIIYYTDNKPDLKNKIRKNFNYKKINSLDDYFKKIGIYGKYKIINEKGDVYLKTSSNWLQKDINKKFNSLVPGISYTIIKNEAFDLDIDEKSEELEKY